MGVGPARAAATTETREVQRLRAKLAAASEVCEAAGRAAVEVSADQAGWREAVSKQQCWDRLSTSKPRLSKPRHANRRSETGKSGLETLDSGQTIARKRPWQAIAEQDNAG
jgi:hypothetical protein